MFSDDVAFDNRKKKSVFFFKLNKPLATNTVLLSFTILNTSQLQTHILLSNVFIVPQHYLVPWSSDNHGDSGF